MSLRLYEIIPTESTQERAAVRNYSALYVHLVWATWKREPLIVPRLEKDLYRGIQAEVRRYGCTVLALGGTGDHVHLLVEMTPSLAPSRLAQVVKGSSSHLANHELESEGLFRWQEGYGAFTVSRWDIPRIAAYIQDQKHHHQEGTLLPDLETIDPF